MVPSMAVLLIAKVLPIILVVRLSFFKTNFITTKWVGLHNYIRAFADPRFIKAIGNSLFYAAAITIPQLTIALFLTLLTLNMGRRIRGYVRFVTYAPTFSAGVIIVSVWRWIFHPRMGLANWLVGLVGIAPVSWLGIRWSALSAVALTIVTCSLGTSVILLYAAMTSVNPELYDAARIDGAGWLRIKLQIVVPMIAPIIVFLALVGLIGSLQIWETVFLLTNGGPDNGTTSMMFDVFQTGFVFGEYGAASARTVIMMGVILCLALLKKRLTAGREDEKG